MSLLHPWKTRYKLAAESYALIEPDCHRRPTFHTVISLSSITGVIARYFQFL